ncbi:MAG: putative sulfate exporter family transporter [Chloroflexi bacterium]|nr:putative sulfate exporter family transporter [Chloroflexota bacterium]
MERVEPLPSPRRWMQAPNLVVSALILIALALLTNRLAAWSPKALEYPLWAAALGLGANLIASVLGVKEKLSQAFRTELFLKIGLVLLGAGVNLTEIMSVGARGVIQALIMVTSVFFFTWWLGGLLNLDKKLRAVMCTAVSICGVSAAIAAAGSVLAKKEQLAYVTALVIVTALPLMVLMPWIAATMGMAPEWAGAWFGGNIDTTAAVVGAGTMYGEAAVKVASIVKMSQNALIGVAAFLLALYWVLKEERNAGERPSAWVIWDRFPKFVLGFILVSILASVGLFTKAQIKDISVLRNWAFTLAFIGIGWDLSFGEFRNMGGRPVLVYLAATVFNTLLALGVAWVIFG